MPGKTWITSTATTSPASEGIAKRRQLWVCGSGPSRARWVQSMASRKQTTASPEKIPIKTQRMRKNISSLKTPSRLENNRRGVLARAAGLGAEAPTIGVGSLIARRPRVFERLTIGQDRIPGAAHRSQPFAVRFERLDP